MHFDRPPATAAWRHLEARSGFEMVYFQSVESGWRIEGCTTAGRELTSAPATFVRAPGLAVERLEQTYTFVGERHYDYTAPVFDVACTLVYDESGLVRDYPGIAVRAS